MHLSATPNGETVVRQLTNAEHLKQLLDELEIAKANWEAAESDEREARQRTYQAKQRVKDLKENVQGILKELGLAVAER